MVLDSFRLDGRVAVVTGAGQGLGEVFARTFAEVGAKVVIAERNEKTGRLVAQRLSEAGTEAIFVATDVTDEASVNRMVEATLERFGRVDVLMNNAGIVHHEEAEKVSVADWKKVVDVNLHGVFLCAQAAGREMIKSGGGSIVNIASMSAHIVNQPQCQASYNATKAAVIHLTKSLAAEWARYNVRVNSISPGYMATDMAKPFFDDPDYGGVWIPLIPMKRPGDPEELAGLALYLASDASSYVTGTDVVIDGGFTLW